MSKAINPTIVVNVTDPRGYDVYIGRSGQGEDGYFGNPYRADTLGGGAIGKKEAIARFQHLFNQSIKVDFEFQRRVLELKGKRLGCPGNCKPGPCHGDVYVKYLEGK